MADVPFQKMHGLGNDFVILDAREASIDLSPEAIARIGDRHRGVGFDQLVRIEPSVNADARLTFFNSDGTEAGACGNGTRCIGRLLLLEGDRTELQLETKGGMLIARRRLDGLITIEMSVPRLDWQDIPLSIPCDTLEVPLDFEDLPRPVAVSMGNPHAVFFVGDLGRIDIMRLGPILEHHSIFPDCANIGFAQMLSPSIMRLRVFERGAGLTLACGSGACAAMVAARCRGLCRDETTVLLDGGELEIAWPGSGPVSMTGPTSFVFRGSLAAELFEADR